MRDRYGPSWWHCHYFISCQPLDCLFLTGACLLRLPAALPTTLGLMALYTASGLSSINMLLLSHEHLITSIIAPFVGLYWQEKTTMHCFVSAMMPLPGGHSVLLAIIPGDTTATALQNVASCPASALSAGIFLYLARNIATTVLHQHHCCMNGGCRGNHQQLLVRRRSSLLGAARMRHG